MEPLSVPNVQPRPALIAAPSMRMHRIVYGTAYRAIAKIGSQKIGNRATGSVTIKI
jgi:hypothetical protein